MQPITCHRPHKVANNRIRFVSGSVSTSAGERERCRAMTPPSLPQVERPPPLAPANQLEARPAAPRHRRLAVGVAVVLHDHRALRTGPARAAERGHGRPCRYRVRPLTQARPRRPRGGARAGPAFGHHRQGWARDRQIKLLGWRGGAAFAAGLVLSPIIAALLPLNMRVAGLVMPEGRGGPSTTPLQRPTRKTCPVFPIA